MGDKKNPPPEGEVTEDTPSTGTEASTTSKVEDKTPKTEKKRAKRTDDSKSRSDEGAPSTKKGKKDPPLEPDVEKYIVQVLVKVHPRIRDKAKDEAELAYLYGWIPEPTVTALFVWLIDTYLDIAIKQFIHQRRGEQPVEATPEQDDSQGG